MQLMPKDPKERLVVLEKMKATGLAVLGDIFRETLAWVQIERQIREAEEEIKNADK